MRHPRGGVSLAGGAWYPTGMTERKFVQEIADTLRCDAQRAEAIVFSVFRELSHRLTVAEATPRRVPASDGSEAPVGSGRAR